MDGLIYLNKLSYFMQLESSVDDGRADSQEAVYLWIQPSDAVFKINVPGVASSELTSNDFAAPIVFQKNKFNDLYVLCLYSIYTDGFDHVNGEIHCKGEDAEKLKCQIEVDERCVGLGEFAIIIPATLFLERVKSALSSQGFAGKGKLISYFDENTFSGEIEDCDIPFTKRSLYSYQHEYRIILAPRKSDNGPIIVNIGSIRDISFRVNSHEINNILKVDSIK